jgi:hypothetical protein
MSTSGAFLHHEPWRHDGGTGAFGGSLTKLLRHLWQSLRAPSCVPGLEPCAGVAGMHPDRRQATWKRGLPEAPSPVVLGLQGHQEEGQWLVGRKVVVQMYFFFKIACNYNRFSVFKLGASSMRKNPNGAGNLRMVLWMQNLLWMGFI